MKKVLRTGLALMLCMLLFALCACSPAASTEDTTPADTEAATTAEEQTSASEAPAETEASEATEAAYEPFTLTVMEQEVTYTHVPEKIVSFNLHTTENLIALGLEDKIIGTAYTNAEVSARVCRDL